ncbi:MAG: hypothetical protein ACJ76H_10005 [Bacteriovoracaceae bacterium]
MPIQSVHANDLSADFSKWSEEYKHEFIDTENIESQVCPISYSPAATLPVSRNFIGMRSCRPSDRQRDLLYDNDLTEQEKRQRDDLICECLKHGNTFEAAIESKLTPQEKQLRKNQWRARASTLSQEEYASRVFGEGFGPAITSMNFADTTKQAEALAGIYLQYDRKVEPRDTESLKSILTPPDLSDQMCVPPREFIFNEQFPMEASFYEDLEKPFNPDDWDYAKLARKFDGITKLEDSNKIPDSKRILNRMKFLLHNPQFKAMFMSPDRDAASGKVQLYKLLQEKLPKPECADQICYPLGNWKDQIHPYQDAAREFLKDKFVIGNIQSGIAEGEKLGWSRKKINTSEIIDDPLHATENEWKMYCDYRNTQPASVNPVLAEIDNEYGIDFENIRSNKDFVDTNKAYCAIPRKDKNNKSMLFGDYRKQNCSQVDRRMCLAMFVQAFPFSTDNMIGLIHNINEILEKPDTIAQVTADSTTTITAIGQDSKVRSRSIHFLDEEPAHTPSPSMISQGSSPVRVTTPATAAAATTPMNQPLPTSQPMFGQEPVFQPKAPISAPIAAPSQKVETIRENLSQGESQAQLLRNEISSLRTQLSERANARSNPNNVPDTALEQRFASLEKRLSDREKENADLRQQMANTQKPQVTPTPESIQSRDSSERQNYAGTTSAGGASVTAPQAATPPTIPLSSPVALGGGSFSSGSLSSSTRSLTSDNGLLAKYGGVDSTSTSGITVSSADGQSVKSVQPLRISSEDFNQLASNDDSALRKYLPQVKVSPGEVVRLSIKADGDRMMEVFVVNNGSELAVFRTSEAANAVATGRQPASVIDRQNTLENLKNEFTN